MSLRVEKPDLFAAWSPADFNGIFEKLDATPKRNPHDDEATFHRMQKVFHDNMEKLRDQTDTL